MTESADSQPNEVCIVDDDPSVLKSMHYLLASEGFKVRPFSRGEDFLTHASKNPVPVVVTDIWMDQVTGLELLARLCAISPRTKVIVITARSNQIFPALASGAFAPPFTRLSRAAFKSAGSASRRCNCLSSCPG